MKEQRDEKFNPLIKLRDKAHNPFIEFGKMEITDSIEGAIHMRYVPLRTSRDGYIPEPRFELIVKHKLNPHELNYFGNSVIDVVAQFIDKHRQYDPIPLENHIAKLIESSKVRTTAMDQYNRVKAVFTKQKEKKYRKCIACTDKGITYRDFKDNENPFIKFADHQIKTSDVAPYEVKFLFRRVSDLEGEFKVTDLKGRIIANQFRELKNICKFMDTWSTAHMPMFIKINRAFYMSKVADIAHRQYLEFKGEAPQEIAFDEGREIKMGPLTQSPSQMKINSLPTWIAGEAIKAGDTLVHGENGLLMRYSNATPDEITKVVGDITMPLVSELKAEKDLMSSHGNWRTTLNDLGFLSWSKNNSPGCKVHLNGDDPELYYGDGTKGSLQFTLQVLDEYKIYNATQQTREDGSVPESKPDPKFKDVELPAFDAMNSFGTFGSDQ